MVGNFKLVAVSSHLIWKISSENWWFHVELDHGSWDHLGLSKPKVQGDFPHEIPVTWVTCLKYTPPQLKYVNLSWGHQKRTKKWKGSNVSNQKNILGLWFVETKIVEVVVFCKLRSQLGRNWACFLSTVCKENFPPFPKTQNSQLLKNKWSDYSLGEHVPIRASFKRSCLSKSRQSDTRQFTTYLAWNHDCFCFSVPGFGFPKKLKSCGVKDGLVAFLSTTKKANKRHKIFHSIWKSELLCMFERPV